MGDDATRTGHVPVRRALLAQQQATADRDRMLATDANDGIVTTEDAAAVAPPPGSTAQRHAAACPHIRAMALRSSHCHVSVVARLHGGYRKANVKAMNRILEQLPMSSANAHIHPLLCSHVSITEVDGLGDIAFFGAPFENIFTDFCSTVSRPDGAATLRSRILRAPDRGLNGTCNRDLTQFVDPVESCPNLLTCVVEQNKPGDSHRGIIGADYTENGVLGRLLHKAPILDSLISPTVPDAGCFATHHAALRYLDVDTGYNTQQYIGHFAEKPCFSQLYTLAFGAYNETYMQHCPPGGTSCEDCRRLVQAPHVAGLRLFVWRNSIRSDAEIEEVRALLPAPDLPLKMILYSANYS